MQLFCPACNATFLGATRCPRCAGLLLMPHEVASNARAASPTAAAAGAPDSARPHRDWHDPGSWAVSRRSQGPDRYVLAATQRSGAVVALVSGLTASLDPGGRGALRSSDRRRRPAIRILARVHGRRHLRRAIPRVRTARRCAGGNPGALSPAARAGAHSGSSRARWARASGRRRADPQNPAPNGKQAQFAATG